MSLRESETTDAISRGIDIPEIATLPLVTHDDKKGYDTALGDNGEEIERK